MKYIHSSNKALRIPLLFKFTTCGGLVRSLIIGVEELGPAGALPSSTHPDTGKSLSPYLSAIVVCSALGSCVKRRAGMPSTTGNNNYVTGVQILAGQQRTGTPATRSPPPEREFPSPEAYGLNTRISSDTFFFSLISSEDVAKSF